ncbi:hypothetical protein [Nitrosomonas sp.]|uniref:hypothetical protein n=1 Tax=Nitrosomonas sp. TaxID=42353 RepID=UPI0025E798C5|nr:hypothetical protein [Nitrosomonas sp.]
MAQGRSHEAFHWVGQFEKCNNATLRVVMVKFQSACRNTLRHKSTGQAGTFVPLYHPPGDSR